MNIKCPAGCGEYDSTLINGIQSELDIHVDNNHEDSTKMLCDLLIKIHEKIEFHEKLKHLAHNPNTDEYVIEILKSLLENK